MTEETMKHRLQRWLAACIVASIGLATTFTMAMMANAEGAQWAWWQVFLAMQLAMAGILIAVPLALYILSTIEFDNCQTAGMGGG